MKFIYETYLCVSNDPQLQLLYDLDVPEEGGISINILPLILSDLQPSQEDGPRLVLVKDYVHLRFAHFEIYFIELFVSVAIMHFTSIKKILKYFIYLLYMC